MNECIMVPIPTTIVTSVVTAIVGAVLGFFWDKKREARKCEACQEHKEHQARIAKMEERQAAIEATLTQVCDQVNRIHDMMVGLFQHHGVAV